MFTASITGLTGVESTTLVFVCLAGVDGADVTVLVVNLMLDRGL